MSSEYDNCARGALKLKGDSGVKKKKKKSKDKEKEIEEKLLEQISKTTADIENASEKSEYKLTKAQIAFMQQQKKMVEKRIKDKASMTHKQRVEIFNRHLDSLTEHFDIPKVSWTK